MTGWAIAGIIQTYAIVLQATRVKQSVFVPLNTTTTQLLNAVIGIIIWEDYRAITSWGGYAVVTVQLTLGIYLVSSLDVMDKATTMMTRRKMANPMIIAHEMVSRELSFFDKGIPEQTERVCDDVDDLLIVTDEEAVKEPASIKEDDRKV